MSRRSVERGFTLIELSLAIVFVAILAMAILTVSLQMMKMYSKGVTLKSVNQVARDVSDQLTRDLRSANVADINTNSLDDRRFCLGTVSYLWNTPQVLEGSASEQIHLNNATGPAIRFVRVSDPGGALCTAAPTYVVNNNKAAELLGDADNNLAIHSLDIHQLNPSGSAAEKQLFSITYEIGTADLSALSTSDGSASCKPPTDASANFDFCTVRRFSQIVKVSQGNS